MVQKFNPKIFYSIEDVYPPYRVDVVELFGRELAQKGADIEWYMRRGMPGPCADETFLGQKVHLPALFRRGGVFAKIATKFFFLVCDIWQLFRCLGKPVDLIQVRDKYIAAAFGLLIARIKGIPFVYWCSYPFPEHYRELANNSSGLRSLYCVLHSLIGKTMLYRIVMPLSNHVFVQSKQMQLDVSRYGVPVCKMTPVPMGVPSRLSSWTSRNSPNITSSRIVYIGSMDSVRNLHMLVDAFALVHARFPFTTLIMVGDSKRKHERVELEQYALSLGLGKAVLFTGFVSIEVAWKYAASAEVCVSPIFPCPVYNCGSPTKLFEYMALGRPVVCNTHPEQTEVIKESGAGLCVDWDAKEFAEAMAWMLENPDKAAAMGEHGPAWVAKSRTYPMIANAVWSKYKDILGVAA